MASRWTLLRSVYMFELQALLSKDGSVWPAAFKKPGNDSFALVLLRGALSFAGVRLVQPLRQNSKQAANRNRDEN